MQRNQVGGSPDQTDDKEVSVLRALLVEDEPADVELILQSLRKGGFQVGQDVVQTAEEFTQLVRRNPYDAVLADYRLPTWNGMESVEVLRREGLDIPVILVSGALYYFLASPNL